MSAASKTTGGTAIGYDVATALWQGNRPYQEDTLLADFHGGMDRGFAVLADGMGGHAAGDLASRLVVIDAVSHLKFLMHDGAALEANLHAELTSAITTANDVLKDRASDDNRLSGMGATFLATVMFEDRLYWASVGDSPLYLWREGQLRQINEDHSMAPVIDQMAKAGEISAEDAANHPDRNALTSVLMGSRIKSMDVPKVGMVLDPGDVLIQASDGLQYLDDKHISEILSGANASATSRDIADMLMAALHDLDDPLQDNTAILVLQLCDGLGIGGGAVVATGATSKSGTQVAGFTGGAASMTNTTQVSAAEVAQPPGRKGWIAPAALLGGAALVSGLIFGLPSEQTDPNLASAALPIETTEPLADTPNAADQVAGSELAQDDAPIADRDDPELAQETADPQTPVEPRQFAETLAIDDTDASAVAEAVIADAVAPQVAELPATALDAPTPTPAHSPAQDVGQAAGAGAQTGENPAGSHEETLNTPPDAAPTAEPTPILGAAEISQPEVEPTLSQIAAVPGKSAQVSAPESADATILFQDGTGVESDAEPTIAVINGSEQTTVQSELNTGTDSSGIVVLGGAGAGNTAQGGTDSAPLLPDTPAQALQTPSAGALLFPNPVPLNTVTPTAAPSQAPAASLLPPTSEAPSASPTNALSGVGPLREGLNAPASDAAVTPAPLRQRNTTATTAQKP